MPTISKKTALYEWEVVSQMPSKEMVEAVWCHWTGLSEAGLTCRHLGDQSTPLWSGHVSTLACDLQELTMLSRQQHSLSSSEIMIHPCYIKSL